MKATTNDRRLIAEKIPVSQGQRPLFVIFTTVQDTLFCLRSVDQLSSGLSLCIHLLAPDQMPHPSVLPSSRMLADFTARYFLNMIPHQSNCLAKAICYPAASEDLWEVLSPQSSIALAGPSRYIWPSPAQRLARKLRQAGHEVLFFPTQSPAPDFFSHKK